MLPWHAAKRGGSKKKALRNYTIILLLLFVDDVRFFLSGYFSVVKKLEFGM